MSIHDGHRQRVKARFRKEGLDNFEEIHVLELLLFYCVSRQDTNRLAHRLLDHFGSLWQVLEATPEQLEQVDGVGEHISTFLTLTNALERYYRTHKDRKPVILKTIKECGEYLKPRFYGRPLETVFLLSLDAKCKVLTCREVSEGSVNSVGIPIRKIVEMALCSNATSVILAHNHPSGLALPSGEDIQTTHRVAKALQSVEITLVDHIIVADDDFVSLVQSGYYHPNDYHG